MPWNCRKALEWRDVKKVQSAELGDGFDGVIRKRKSELWFIGLEGSSHCKEH